MQPTRKETVMIRFRWAFPVLLVLGAFGSGTAIGQGRVENGTLASFVDGWETEQAPPHRPREDASFVSTDRGRNATLQMVSPLIPLFTLSIGRNGTLFRSHTPTVDPGGGLELGIPVDSRTRFTFLLHDMYSFDAYRGGYLMTNNLRVSLGPEFSWGPRGFKWFLFLGITGRYLHTAVKTGALDGKRSFSHSFMGAVSVMTGPEIRFSKKMSIGLLFSHEHILFFSRRGNPGRIPARVLGGVLRPVFSVARTIAEPIHGPTRPGIDKE
jgi:hypothetical protein